MKGFFDKIFIFGAIAMFVGTGLLTPKFADGPTENLVAAAALTQEEEVFEPIKIVAVGDIMLGRNVENLSIERGWDHPFSQTEEIFRDADYVLANFEGTIPEVHKKTPNMGFQFSFLKDAVDALERSGVNIVSLANNHAFDFGEETFFRTREELLNRGIIPFGHPGEEEANFTRSIVQDDATVHFIGFNDTYLTLDIDDASEMVKNFSEKEGITIVSIHWGDEYKLKSNSRQQKIARALIDSGADIIIGHHPHVVQEVEIYKGATIFYSLGNFIFDQYFSDETQEGLAVEIEVKENSLGYNLIPIYINRSVPERMETEEARAWIQKLLERSPTLRGII